MLLGSDPETIRLAVETRATYRAAEAACRYSQQECGRHTMASKRLRTVLRTTCARQ
jgi:hypothetical protein